MRRPRLSLGSSDASAVSDDAAATPPQSWEEYLDGRLRRLKRGKHYSGNPAVLVRHAELAARSLDKKAFTYHDQIGKFEYIWIQFLDSKISGDQACKRCGGTDFKNVQQYFRRCSSCQALYRFNSRTPTTDAAEFLSIRLLSLHGEELEHIRVLDEAVVEAICAFSRPVAAAHLSFTFFASSRKALRSACPDLIVVPTAEAVKMRLHLDANVLTPGQYTVTANVELVLDDKDRRIHKVGTRELLTFTVLDPSERPSDGERERSSLHWSAVSALDERPMPIFARADEPEGDDLEDEA